MREKTDKELYSYIFGILCMSIVSIVLSWLYASNIINFYILSPVLAAFLLFFAFTKNLRSRLKYSAITRILKHIEDHKSNEGYSTKSDSYADIKIIISKRWLLLMCIFIFVCLIPDVITIYKNTGNIFIISILIIIILIFLIMICIYMMRIDFSVATSNSIININGKSIYYKDVKYFVQYTNRKMSSFYLLDDKREVIGHWEEFCPKFFSAWALEYLYTEYQQRHQSLIDSICSNTGLYLISIVEPKRVQAWPLLK